MADYHKLSVAQKEAANRLHEPPTRCPVCEMAVQPDDLLAHVDKRCEGRPEPHPRSRWVTRKDALAMGASWPSLKRWANTGKVRIRRIDNSRRYLLRDLTKCLAAARTGLAHEPAENPESKTLTNRARKDPMLRMGTPIETELAKRLAAFVESVGGYAAAGRKLDIPSDTLRRAALGEKVRRGTVVLIDRQITELANRQITELADRQV